VLEGVSPDTMRMFLYFPDCMSPSAISIAFKKLLHAFLTSNTGQESSSPV
jgi:hypothetical protein